MHWIFKVIFIVIYCTTISSCRPLSAYSEKLYPKQKRLNQVHNRNSIQELSKNNLNGVLRHRSIRHQTSGNGQESSVKNRGPVASDKSHTVNEMKKRNLDVGILVNYPTEQSYDSGLEKLEAMLADALANRLVEENYSNTSSCPSCEEEEEVIIKRIIQPAYNCDEWDAKHRVCILERNIGDTVTFYLSTGKDEGTHKLNVTWKKEFHMRDSKDRKEFQIDPQNPPENIIIGRRGFELRVSPVTETDAAYNMFSASLRSHPTFKSKLYFMIRIVPIDLGFVYVGESVELNLRKFVSIPEQSMSFKWYMEKDGEHGTLPSNMKVSITGSSIKISELRQEQEGILACSVYTNLHILATKKRFLIKDLSKNKDVLQSSPNHTLMFKEEFREKRDRKKILPYLSSLRLSRQKRARIPVEEVERALLQPSQTEKEIPSYRTGVPIANDYDPDIQPQQDEPEPFDDSQNKFQEISDDFGDLRNVPGNKQVGIPMNRNPTSFEEPVEGQRILQRPQPINEELSLQAGVPVDEMDSPDTMPAMNRQNNLQKNYLRNRLVQQSDQYIANKVPLQSVSNKMQNGPGLDISVSRPNMQQKEAGSDNLNGAQYVDLDIQAKGGKPSQKAEYSDIVLNIGGLKERRKITAEMQIGKLISYCYSDFECSVIATCVRTSLKIPGFCKCLPGSNGVGIFCREEVWLSNSNFDMQEHDADYMGYSDTSPQE